MGAVMNANDGKSLRDVTGGTDLGVSPHSYGNGKNVVKITFFLRLPLVGSNQHQVILHQLIRYM